ncbi:hypothetical protein BDZ45DRAFT_126760 [Acephala macrosclerotiorum]|nr:hypothetical protein BDZ45DRAFT_126760 [Acephala macrosclerotiorum]
MGNFTLTEAKLIDVGFNAFGRILQTALGYVTYRNIMDMLMRALESMPVTFALYSALTLQSCTISTIGSAFNAMVSTIDWRPRFIFMMIWTILSTAFVFIFPTLMDLMSGYVPKQDSYIQFPDRTMIPFDANITNATLAQLELLHGKVRLVNGEPPKTCAHSQDRAYQWGISAFWMKVTWYSLGAWMIGTYSAWMDAQYNCELLQKKRTMNTYRAVVDLAGAMTEVLGPNMDAYSGPELENALRGESFCEENPGEIGRVMYTTEIDEATGLGRIKLSARKRGKLGKLDFNTEYGEKRF